VFTIKSDYGLSETSYDIIVKCVRSILPEGNRLKENFNTTKSMIRSFSLEYQKIDMCPNFMHVYYLENADLTMSRTCEHAWYNPITGKGRTYVAHRKLRYFSITLRMQKVIYVCKDC
jgi:hypothetical protein